MIASLIKILKETTDLTFHKNNTLRHDYSFYIKWLKLKNLCFKEGYGHYTYFVVSVTILFV
jgi:hypothetical protein